MSDAVRISNRRYGWRIRHCKKVNFSAQIGDPSFPESLVSDKWLKRFLDTKAKFCSEFQQKADGFGVYVDVDADFARTAIEVGKEQVWKLQYMIATHDDLDSLKYASRHMLATCETLEKLEILDKEYA